jgi:predicted Zn-dependent protease
VGQSPGSGALARARVLVDAAWQDTKVWTQNYQRAQTELEDALRVSPRDTALLTALGAVLADCGFHKEAVAALERAIDLGSADGNTYYNLAVARIELSPSATFKRLFALAERYERNPETWRAYFDPQGR